MGTSDDLSKSFARTLKDVKAEFEADNVRRLQARLERNSANLRRFSGKLETLSRKQGNQSAQLLKKQTKTRPLFDPVGLTAACKVHSSRCDGRTSNDKCCEDEVEFRAANGTKLLLTKKHQVRLDVVQNVPPYISWVFVQKNEFITEDLPVIGHQKVYYDGKNCALVDCTKSSRRSRDELDDGNTFHKFDDSVIVKMIEKHGSGHEVLEELATILDKSCDEVKARYDEIEAEQSGQKTMEASKSSLTCSSTTSRSSSNVDKAVKDAEEDNETPDDDRIHASRSLKQAMDAFECLFCRRCLVFDCVLHGCSQELALPNEVTRHWTQPDVERSRPCSSQCVLQPVELNGVSGIGSCEEQGFSSIRKQDASCSQRMGVGTTEGHLDRVGSSSALGRGTTSLRDSPAAVVGSKRKFMPDDGEPSGGLEDDSEKIEEVQVCWKRTKDQGSNSIRLTPETEHHQEKGVPKVLPEAEAEAEAEADSGHLIEEKTASSANEDIASTNSGDQGGRLHPVADLLVETGGDNSGWTNLEKDLYEKGLQIFGFNSCLISQNLLKGWKTCIEVSKFMTTREGCQKVGGGHYQPIQAGNDQESDVRPRGGGGRRKGRAGRKGSGSSMTNALRQRLSDLAKRDVYTNYNPCACFPTCGKECPCKLNATCCEKLCGCASSCKYRFRGCNCAKGHCSTRNCPCFAASRECDPDVCRKCWISCGDGSCIGPPQREDICDCHNMSLFLGQKQRVLLGRSSIVGWGAFLKNPVEKNTFLGEYTGELITHDEAERRGRKYDHEGRSYLFNLNNEFCIDAYRKGDKLKFANHSSHPNCFAKIVLVSGDHRVGIFAKERITAGEELFYDYDYAPESCPDWAVKVNEEDLRQSRQNRANSKFARKAQHPRKLKKPAKRLSLSDP